MNNYGLNDTFDYLEIELDPLDAERSGNVNYSITDWPVFEIGGKIPLKDVAAIKVLSATVPFTYYVFSSRNNSWLFSENGGAQTRLTITPGNYALSELLTIIPGLMSAASTTGTTYQAVYSPNTGKVTYSASVPGTMTSFSFQFGTDSTNRGVFNPRLKLGFNGGLVTSVGAVLVSPNVVNISGSNNLYICSSQWGQQTQIYLAEGSIQGGNTGPQLAQVPVNVNSGDNIDYVDPSPLMWFSIGNANAFQFLDIYFTLGNDDEFPISLNGGLFALKLGILIRKTTHTEYSYDGKKRLRIA